MGCLLQAPLWKPIYNVNDEVAIVHAYTSVKYNSVSKCKSVSVFLTTASSHGDVPHDILAEANVLGTRYRGSRSEVQT